MCKGSVVCIDTTVAMPNQTYCISNGGDHGKIIAVLHEPDKGYNDDSKIRCAVCIYAPTKVIVTNVPSGVRRGYDLDTDTLEGTFLPSFVGSHAIDIILLESGYKVPLNDLVGEDARLRIIVDNALDAEDSSHEQVARAA